MMSSFLHQPSFFRPVLWGFSRSLFSLSLFRALSSIYDSFLCFMTRHIGSAQ